MLEHTRLIDNYNDTFNMFNNGILPELEYLKCCNFLNEDIITRLSIDITCTNNKNVCNEEYIQLLENFIKNYGLEAQLQEYLRNTNDELMKKYYDCCSSLVNKFSYLKSQGESLPKIMIDEYIKAKEILNNSQN